MADDWLPPEQIATHKFPIVGERRPSAPALALDRWSLTIDGHVRTPLQLDWAAFEALPQSTMTMDVHCVTRWSRRGVQFTGVPLSLVLERAVVEPDARYVAFTAWSARDHDTSLPLERARSDAWLIHSMNGEPLSPAHGGPLRVVTRGRYFYKSLKWVRRVELLVENRLGYWERTDGYHDNADPWPGDQRYVSGSLKPRALASLREGLRFDQWHGRTIRSADLRGWSPASRALGPLKLKNCDLRDAELAGAELAGANLTLSDLRGANLRGANLRGADLEGAQLAGADLRHADLTGAFLTATTFFEGPLSAPTREAQVDGLQCAAVTGLLEAPAAWLEARVGPIPSSPVNPSRSNH